MSAPRRRTVVLSLGLLILAFPAAALAQARPERVRMTVPAFGMNLLPVLLHRHTELYREEGVTLDLVLMGGHPTLAALMAGEVHYTTSNDTIAVGALQGMPVKLLAFWGLRPSFSLVVRPEIRSVADLRGKAISVSRARTLTDWMARRIVRHYGLNPDRDITTIGVGGHTERLAALKSSDVGGAIVDPPNDLLAERQGYRILLRASEVVKELLQSALGTTEQHLRDRPDQVRRVLRGLLRSLRFIREQRDATVQVIMKIWQVDLGIAEKSYDTVVPNFSRDGTATPGAIRQAVEQTRELLGTTKPLDLDKIQDLRLLHEVQRELGLR